MALFNKNAGTKFDVKLASFDALDAIKLKPSRVCPLVCEHGFKAEGDRCSKIVCAEGSFLNDDNECEKRRGKTPAARQNDDNRRTNRDRQDRAYGDRLRPEGYAPAKPLASRSSGQIICDIGGCRPVRSGCHIENDERYALKGSGGQAEICR